MEISVIIPTHARRPQLISCLEALAQLDFQPDSYEVIVVDDGGPEPEDQWDLPFSHALDLTVAHQPRGGPAAARNAGARLARGNLLVFTDDDCRPAEDWLTEIAAAHLDAPDRLIGGRTVNGLGDNPYATTSQVIIEAAYAHYNSETENARFFASNNMAIPADLFRKVGGFDEEFRIASEDRELCDRWLHLGYAMTSAPRAVVLHRHDLSFAGFCRQHFDYGRGAAQFHRVRRHRGSGTLNREVRFHARFLALLRRPLARIGPARALPVLALLALWQLLNLAGYLSGLGRKGRSILPPRPA